MNVEDQLTKRMDELGDCENTSVLFALIMEVMGSI